MHVRSEYSNPRLGCNRAIKEGIKFGGKQDLADRGHVVPGPRARLLAEGSYLSQLSFRILIASSTALAKCFLIQAYRSLLSFPDGV